MSLLFFESEMDMPAKMVVLPLRSTVVKTSKGVVIISPIPFSPEQLKQIESLGSVTDIVSPSLIHYLHIKRTAAHFKEAKIWGVPGCEQKEQMKDIKWDKIFGRDVWPHEGVLETQMVEGIPVLNEIVFFEKSSKTLITTDFVFNLTHPKGWFAPVMLRMLGTYKKFGISRLTKKFMKNQAAYENSVRKILSWDFNTVVMAHGDIVSSNAKSKLVHSLEENGYHVK